MTETALKPFDVGPDGIAGRYSNMLAHAKPVSLAIIWLGIAWWLWFSWPFDLSPDTEISSNISLAGLIGTVLFLLTVATIYPLLRAHHFYVEWQKLEKDPEPQYVKIDGEHKRVLRTFTDLSVEVDHRSPEQISREAWELWRFHNNYLVQSIYLICGCLLLLILTPLIFTYIFDITGPVARRWLLMRDAEDWTQFAIIWLLLAPALLGAFWTLWEHVMQSLGRQFVPGAIVEQAKKDPALLPDMKAKHTFGSADRVEPVYGAKKLSD